jgi:hypothetical protein
MSGGYTLGETLTEGKRSFDGRTGRSPEMVTRLERVRRRKKERRRKKKASAKGL